MTWNKDCARVICLEHGLQSLSRAQFETGLSNSRLDGKWCCPVCGQDSEWVSQHSDMKACTRKLPRKWLA